MKTEALLRDPGFQLNLLLWMTRQQPATGYVVRPLFHELGFRLVYIESPFPLPEETVAAVEASGLGTSIAPEPDVILQHQSDRKALYVEAKAHSFTPESSNARQARGHLLATAAFPEVMAPGFQCLLCYLVPEADRTGMDATLSALATELRNAAFVPGAHSVHGLSLEGSDLRYAWDTPFRAHTGVAGDAAVILRGVTEDTDPSPLFLIFSAEDYPDPERQDLCRTALQKQVHAVLLCELHRFPVGAEYARTVDELLLTTTAGVFQYIGSERRKTMRHLIRANLFRRIFRVWRDKAPGLVHLEEDVLKVQFRDERQREEFLDWLEDAKRTDFSTSTPPEEALPLLQMMEPPKAAPG